MCGIAGFINYRSERLRSGVLEQMAASLRYRGPDAQKVVSDGVGNLAHARLSIIDLAGSTQPMKVSGCSITLVYNGEIYDYAVQRQTLLAAGIHLETKGDTEVVLRMIERSWEKELDQLDGMFAIGAWDVVNQKLLLARDPLGKKPLFYALIRPDLIVFGSEIKALLEHPDLAVTLNENSLRQALRFRAVYGDQSLYKGVSQVEPGCWLEFSKNGIRRGRFYDLPSEARRSGAKFAGRTDADLTAEGEALLLGAVKKRLVADVPVGAFLSGGLDSSLIVAMMRECQDPGATICTYSVGFKDDDYSELPFAQAMADHTKTHHTEVRVGAAEYIRHLSEMSAFRDAPVSEPADVAIALMSRRAAESVKVVLSGEGADEVFCGYPKFHLAELSMPLRASVRWIGAERLAKLASLVGGDDHRTLVAARSLSHHRELDRLVQWFSYMDRGMLQMVLPGLNWTDAAWEETVRAQQDALDRAGGFDPTARMQITDCLTWLPGNLLERGDRMTMQAGLEARVPFLDKGLAGWGIALPNRLKVGRGVGKRIVRQWARKRLPRNIVNRRKWGFRVPLAKWFRSDLRSMVFDYLQSKEGLCGTYGDTAKVNQLLEDHDHSKSDHHLALWTLLASEVWYHDVFVKRDLVRGSIQVESPQRAQLLREVL